jgi:hypothetical protein
MKKLIFTLMMMAGLALVAGTAMAVNEKTVYTGSTYSYELTGIASANAATTTVNYVDNASNDVTITETSGYSVPSSSTNHTVAFTVAYGSTAESGIITVEITDGTSTCSNSIELHITVMPPPVYTLTISASETSTCQQGTGADDNLADKRGGETNTITYTITPVVENVISGVDYTYDFDFVLPTNAVFTTLTSSNGNVTTYPNGNVSVSGTGTGSGDQGESAVTIDVTFETVVGEQTQTITASLPDVTVTSNAALTIEDGSNSGAGTVIAGEIATGGNSSVDVNILAVPDMGSFQ